MAESLPYTPIRATFRIPLTHSERRRALFFEDFAAGQELPTVTKGPMMVGHQVRWAGARDNYDWEFHHDEYVAKAQGLPGIILSGPLMASYLVSALAHWLGRNARLLRFSDRNVGSTMPRDMTHLHGRICAYGSWGSHRPSLALYVTLTGPKEGATASAGRSWCLSSKGKGALPRAHPGIEQACYMLEGRAHVEVEKFEMAPGDASFYGFSFTCVGAGGGRSADTGRMAKFGACDNIWLVWLD